MNTDSSSTIGIDNVRGSHAFRCTPASRRRHMVVRHIHSRPASRSVPVDVSAPAPAPVMLRTAERPSRIGRRPIDRLTRRQLEVLSLMAEGHSNASIARLCYISEKAVVQHTSQIYDRLDLPNDAAIHRRVQAVVIFLREAA
jgi:DNA-binding NarL/FixJ family response regulator